MDPQQPKFDENEVKTKIDKDLKNMSILKDMLSKFAKIENGIQNNLFNLTNLLILTIKLKK